jgi:ribosomal-protein-alanine N-acetyltransferase
MNNITLRRMTSADIPQVSAIENTVFTLPWSAQSISGQVANDNDHSLVACLAGDGLCLHGYPAPLGSVADAEMEHRACAAMTESAQPPQLIVGYALIWHTADEAEIGNIAVAVSFRRMGVARQLLQAVIDEAAASGIRTIFLEARAGNVAAIKLYEGFGFASYNTRKGLYVQPDEDGILMKKDMMTG